MRVRAIRNHFDAGSTYRTEGEEFDYKGKLHEHIEPVDKAARKPEVEGDKGKLHEHIEPVDKAARKPEVEGDDKAEK